MSWKNTQQTSLEDALIIEHKSLSDLDDVHNIINWSEIEQTLFSLFDFLKLNFHDKNYFLLYFKRLSGDLLK